METLNARLTAISKELGLPLGVVYWRHYNGYPLDKKYTPRATGAAAGALRRAALEKGLTRYDSTPCGSCGGVTRYTANGNCVACLGG